MSKPTTDRNHFRLFLFISSLLVAAILYGPSRILGINNQLMDNPAIQSYPYHFRVMRLKNGVASVSDLPRDEATLTRCLMVLFPELRQSTDPELGLAKKRQELDTLRQTVREMALAHKSISSVEFAEDETWLRLYGPAIAIARIPENYQFPQPQPAGDPQINDRVSMDRVSMEPEPLLEPEGQQDATALSSTADIPAPPPNSP